MWRVFWVVAATLLCCFSFASAQQVPTDVAFGGEFFFRFRANAGSLEPEIRASVLQGRLTQVFSRLMEQGEPISVEVRSHGNFLSIWVSGVLFVTATKADARANKTSPSSLANIWRHNIESGLKAILSRKNEGRTSRQLFSNATASRIQSQFRLLRLP
ncbi:MAG: hypothetical protein ACUVTP_00870 [Candidatus Fervidibacter sp.]|uniref:hypothetical protein n=1 Tax=Candidatus Fervidibacter sp. TaxID=3100871 RepID=UPI00404A6DA1